MSILSSSRPSKILIARSANTACVHVCMCCTPFCFQRCPKPLELCASVFVCFWVCPSRGRTCFCDIANTRLENTRTHMQQFFQCMLFQPLYVVCFFVWDDWLYHWNLVCQVRLNLRTRQASHIWVEALHLWCLPLSLPLQYVLPHDVALLAPMHLWCDMHITAHALYILYIQTVFTHENCRCVQIRSYRVLSH